MPHRDASTGTTTGDASPGDDSTGTTTFAEPTVVEPTGDTACGRTEAPAVTALRRHLRSLPTLWAG